MKKPTVALFVFLVLICFSLEYARASEAKGDYEIVLENNKFTPAELTIPAGQKVKVVVKNKNAAAAEFESHDFHREKIIKPGKEAVVFVGPLDPGTYNYFDEFHPESTGKIIVK